jgi:hypothetical protein
VKLKALVITLLFLAGVAASVAVAKGPPPGKGKDKRGSTASSTSSTGAAAPCRPQVAVVLKGDFVSGSGSEDEGVFQMRVRQANNHGRRYLAETVTIAYDERTRFTRRGHAEFGDFEAGDWLNVQARACKAKKPKRGSTGSTSTSTSTTPSTGSTGTATGPSGAAAELLARRVTGKPGRAAGTTTGTTTGP